ncbi:DUF3955 domain-containing protein [Ferrimonas futtsuensis]|uniref:DUF3955 domain-containing protein n=1 Tax=Ferrimonas futtsuensis TaxID=364764 RepID=UPI000425BE3B|nr:DUF3955 domain-containing protein [Ferrimonas futtsuensis]
MPLLLLGLSLLCMICYHLIGSRVDESGSLVEPFALIPLGWMLLLLSLVSLVVQWFRLKRATALG